MIRSRSSPVVKNTNRANLNHYAPQPIHRPARDARQHASARRAIDRGILLHLPSFGGAERRPMAGRCPGAVLRPAHGLHLLRDHRGRRATELGRAPGTTNLDRGSSPIAERRDDRGAAVRPERIAGVTRATAQQWPRSLISHKVRVDISYQSIETGAHVAECHRWAGILAEGQGVRRALQDSSGLGWLCWSWGLGPDSARAAHHRTGGFVAENKAASIGV
jgi:hypothetical protein